MKRGLIGILILGLGFVTSTFGMQRDAQTLRIRSKWERDRVSGTEFWIVGKRGFSSPALECTQNSCFRGT
jgi:hypothetical protein